MRALSGLLLLPKCTMSLFKKDKRADVVSQSPPWSSLRHRVGRDAAAWDDSDLFGDAEEEAVRGDDNSEKVKSVRGKQPTSSELYMKLCDLSQLPSSVCCLMHSAALDKPHLFIETDAYDVYCFTRSLQLSAQAFVLLSLAITSQGLFPLPALLTRPL